MPTPKDDPFASIDSAQLATVAGGAARVTARSGGSDDQLTAMLTQITSAISDLGKNQQSGMDPTMMMMMMMMGGGSGGGGGGGYAPGAASGPPVINVTTRAFGGGGGGGGGCCGGCKGW